MSAVVVGISEMRVSGDKDSSLVTYALGSCIGVLVWDPWTRMGGLLHYMLPESSLDPIKAKQTPAMYADTGIVLLLRAIEKLGVNPKKCEVWVAGGAQVLDRAGIFQIGKRNYLAAKKILWKEGVLITAEAAGGSVSRTVRLDLAKGQCMVREEGGVEIELRRPGLKERNLCRFAS